MPDINSRQDRREHGLYSPPPRPRCYVEYSPSPALSFPKRDLGYSAQIKRAGKAGDDESTGRTRQARFGPGFPEQPLRSSTGVRTREPGRRSENDYASYLPKCNLNEARPSYRTSRASPPLVRRSRPQQGHRRDATPVAQTGPTPGAATTPQGHFSVPRPTDRYPSELPSFAPLTSKQSGVHTSPARASADPDPDPEVLESYTPYSLTLRVKFGAPRSTTFVIKISMIFEHGKLPRIKIRSRRPRRRAEH